MTRAQPLRIACAADDKYAAHAAALMHSLLIRPANAPCEIFFLHAPSFSAASRQKLSQFVGELGGNLRLLEISDSRLDRLPTLERIGKETWFRTLLPELLPHVDRILYLDADTLVMDDLDPLWNTELGDHYLAAVPNVFEHWRAGRPAELGLIGRSRYFNAGVLLMNLEAWRTDHCTERLLQYARERSRELVWSDQDALNAVLAQKSVELHPRWNCQNSLFFLQESASVFPATIIEEATRRPGILHFEGPGFAKPWHYLNTHPFRSSYWRHVRATPFPLPRIEGRTLRNIIVYWTRPLRPVARMMNLAISRAGNLVRRVSRRARRLLALHP